MSDEQLPKPILTESQAKRANQSLKGMVISVLLTLAVVIPVMLMNPFNQENNFEPDVDVSAVAAQAAQSADFAPLDPDMPEGWYPNFARWQAGSTDGVAYWEAGYVTDQEGFVWLKQTDAANPTWIAQHAESAPVTGQRQIGGTTWEERSVREDDGAPQVTLVGTVDGTTVLLSSDSGPETLEAAALAVLEPR
ncbi:DUF4245 domain-containing protein [Zhihengliuella salsuginis]|uniref:DUF4245 domain-containing protein n=1 Tax=Zhihengliuella salsuginis TaxID=578222 RepID=A0ABQ3GIW9_9MICC|nr:DUF4245 domain-containing protein [Zhihengliuella salsuginis]GHD09624.1 hypothetical protein GCM10008096_22470 [Zhihengliuella salsuginis]